MKGNIAYILLIAIIVFLYIINVKNTPKKIDWSLTLRKTDKNPYGCFIFFKSLASLFPNAAIETSTKTAYSCIESIASNKYAYFLISKNFQITKVDLDALREFVEKGNSVFIASHSFGAIEKIYHIKVDEIQYGGSLLKMYFKDTRLKKHVYSPKKILEVQPITYSFEKYNNASVIPLGTNHLNKVNFLKIPIGKGNIYLHSMPKIFSNYHLLSPDGVKYLTGALRYLPADIKRVIWDEYYHDLAHTNRPPLLQFINTQPGLSFAYWGSILLLILYVFIESKRKQKIIPVFEPVSNTTLEFAETVGMLYFNQHNNLNLAQKIIYQFSEYLTNYYNISPDFNSKDFKTLLAKKSGLEEEFLGNLFQKIQILKNSEEEISDKELLVLNRMIDQFYERIQKLIQKKS